MIRIEHMILNILDKNTGNLVCAQKEMDLTDPLVINYMDKLVKKIEGAEGKQGVLAEDHHLVSLLKKQDQSFAEKAEYLSKELFSIIAPAEEVLGGDVAIFTGKNEQDAEFFGLIKLNYANKYTHFVDYEDDGLTNRLILNQAILPSPTQKVEEAILVTMEDLSYHLLEKKYKIEGERIFYFSKLFLKITPNNLVSEDIRTIKTAIDAVAKKYNEEKYISRANTQEAVYESLDKESMIDPEYVAEVVFPENSTAKEEYLERVREKGIVEKIPVANTPRYEKKYSKQKFKLDNGIELVIPMEVYKNKEMVEFINNPDGTISVIIKNIDEVTNKFR